jgi:hypothetical protein
VRIFWLAQTWTPPAARTPFSWHSVGFTCCCRILSARSSCCGFRRCHEFTRPKTIQASLGLGFLPGTLSAGSPARWLAMPTMRKFPRSAGSSFAACWEGMWKKTLSPFAVDAIGKSISVPRLPRGRSEEWNERHDAHRVCFPPDHDTPVLGRVPLVDYLEFLWL